MCFSEAICVLSLKVESYFYRIRYLSAIHVFVFELVNVKYCLFNLFALL